MKRHSFTDHHDGELRLYRAVHKSGGEMGYWYYEVNIPNNERIRDKSTKQREFASALMFAETQYQKLKTRAMMGISIAATSYRQVFKQAHKYYGERVKAGLLDPLRFHRFEAVNVRAVIPYFEEIERDFGEINSLDIENWIVWRKAKGQRQRGWHNKSKLPKFHPDRPVSNGTINMELQMIRMVFDYAEKSELSLPAQRPTIKSLRHSIKQTRRPEFTWSEWNKITNYLTNHYLDDMPPHMAQSNLAPIYAYYRRSNQYFWQLLFMSMCRVGELKSLKWGNIDDRKVKDPTSQKRVQRLIISVDGKTGKRQVVCQPYAAKLFADWKQHCENFNVTTEPTDLVFRHPDFSNHGEEKAGEEIETTNVAFKRVLDKLGIGKDADGKQRKVYSIRHTAINNSLRRNVSLNAISKNAGVSVETLTRAYDHTQSSDYIMELTKHDYTGFDRASNRFPNWHLGDI